MMKVLVTGFQPFGKDTMNPSYEAVKLLPNEIMGAQIVNPCCIPQGRRGCTGGGTPGTAGYCPFSWPGRRKDRHERGTRCH